MVMPEVEIHAELGELSIHFGADTVVIQGPNTDPATAVEVPPSPDALREWTRVDDEGRYRPLTTARGMRGGWFARFDTLDAFAEGVEAIYPLAQEQIAAWAGGALRIVGLDDVLGRQSGRYHVAASLDQKGRTAARRVLCAQCVRTPAWDDTAMLVEPENLVPCPEACSVLVSLCREAALWQQDAPDAAPVDAAVAFAAFDQPGNATREAYLRARREVTDG